LPVPELVAAARVLDPPHLAAVYPVLALALAVGMRLALRGGDLG
jgi:hypothetical protein